MQWKPITDHTEIVKAIRAQNWKLGGTLTMDVPEAEEMVFALINEAAAEIHRRCVEVAEEAIAKLGTSNIEVHEARGAERVLSAIKDVNHTV